VHATIGEDNTPHDVGEMTSKIAGKLAHPLGL